MKMLKRIGLFVLTNVLVMVTISLVVSLVCRFLGIAPYASGYAGLLVLCLVWGFGGAMISLLISRWIAKTFHGVRVIDPHTMNMSERRLIDTVYRIARNAGMQSMPEVGYYEAAEVNAFATGPSESHSLVAVSTGLLNSMSDAELEGVLGHEIAHIVNGDMVTMTLIQGVVNAFAMFFAQILTMVIMNALRRNDDDRRSGFGDFMLRQMIYNVASIFLTLLGSIAVNYFSRRREFRADAGGARFTSTEKMTAALEKLQRFYQLTPSIPQAQETEKRDANMATLKISDNRRSLSFLFATHPPIEERIAALKNKNPRV